MDFVRSDAILMEILRERATLTGFLDSIFGFLRRNTDFYHIKDNECDKIGIAREMREQILFKAMQRYDPEAFLYNLAADGNAGVGECVPPATAEVEVLNESLAKNSKTQQSSTKNCESSFSPADYKNGAAFDNYCWSQTLKDVEIQVKLPIELRSAKLISVEFKADSLTVRSRKESQKVIISGQFSHKIKCNDAVWMISEGKLLISFDKNKEIWWERLLPTEDGINLKTLDCERFIDELPEESQVAINQVRVQQLEQQKNDMAMLKTNPDIIERLRKAWDVDGSPFKGQPFDPTMLKLS